MHHPSNINVYIGLNHQLGNVMFDLPMGNI